MNMNIESIKNHIEELGKMGRYSPKVEAFKREVSEYLKWKNTPKYKGESLVLNTDEEEENHFLVVAQIGELVGLTFQECLEYVDYVERNCMEFVAGVGVKVKL